MPFDTPPGKVSIQVEPFKAQVSDQDLADFKTLLKVSRIGPKTYENQNADAKDMRGWGVSRDWLETAKEQWLNKYDWRKTEARINSFNNFTATIDDNGFDFKIHFVALYSKKPDAVPIIVMHGWPGSILEFLSVIDELRNKYDENNLPFHFIVPSLPGYGYSNGPPIDKDFALEDATRLMDKLMVGLGFGDGYIAQGGDVGSFLGRLLGAKYPSCKACHFNMISGPMPTSAEDVKSWDPKALARTKDFVTLGTSYGLTHATRPSTIGLVLSSNPLALLAWVGEKFEQWTDKSPPLDDILDSVTLYWFTDSLPRNIYPYRHLFGENAFSHAVPEYHIKKPIGYSWQQKELLPAPASAAAKTGNLIWTRERTEGGHFAAMEIPKEFVRDMEDFVKEAWPKAKDAKF